MDKQSFPYWMAVGESEFVKFSELAHLIAKAIHPSDAESLAYGAARAQLDEELPREVEAGKLFVRNPAGMGRHEFPYGDSLKRAVLMPHDLTQFLADRGIELRFRPHGSGPTLWTLSNSALAVAEQEGWHDGGRGAFLDSMMEAADRSALKVRDPRTDLISRPRVVRSDWELITVNDLNEWLAAQDAPYRWNLAPLLMEVPKQSPRDFKPWETLPEFFKVINGVYMYQQAARQIADAEGWDDSKLGAFEARMRDAVNDGTLKIRCRKTGMVIEPNAIDSLMLVSVDDVNEWLKNEGVNYRWKVATVISTAIKEHQVSQAEKLTNTWDEYALRRLLDESREGDATHRKLAEKYGVSRQRIGALLTEAKNLFNKAKPSAFPTIVKRGVRK